MISCGRRIRGLSTSSSVSAKPNKYSKADGIDVLKKIKSHPESKDIPIAILTSSQDQMDWIESHSSGVVCFLRKSMNFDELVEATGWAMMGAIDRDKSFNFQQ